LCPKHFPVKIFLNGKKNIQRNLSNTSTVADEQVELLHALIVVGLFVGGGRLPLTLQGLPDLTVVYPPCDAQRHCKAQDRPFKPITRARVINTISYISVLRAAERHISGHKLIYIQRDQSTGKKLLAHIVAMNLKESNQSLLSSMPRTPTRVNTMSMVRCMASGWAPPSNKVPSIWRTGAGSQLRGRHRPSVTKS
jgi:hypothetical protein